MDEAVDPRLNVVLCWHLHQPQYRDQITGEHRRPWTYLHGIKDYVDMAVHLEAVPGACAVVNFSPVLLEQLDDYCTSLAAHLRSGAPLRDRVLALLTPEGLPADRSLWPGLAQACLRAHREHQVERFPAYRDLAERCAQLLREGRLGSADPQQLQDLAVWYHLAWLGESVRRGDPRAAELMARERGFRPADCRLLLECIADVLSGLVPRYRRLAGSGRVELSVSPWGHPILPLLFDFGAAQETQPGLELPAAGAYPGGADRARWHLARALQVFSRSFGLRPRGCWPADGAVSEATLELLESFGFDWVASGEAVLRRSLAAAGAPEPDAATRCSGYRRPQRHAACFFREDRLSDLVGFTYSRQDPEAAAADLVLQLERLAGAMPQPSRQVVTLVMDGQNAWEYYRDNAWGFLRAMYARLGNHPRLRLTTLSRCLQRGVQLRPLERLVAGSWIDGSLGTWIGDARRNRAWSQLCEAKSLFDQVVVEGSLEEGEQTQAEEQLGICEGSDWFWSLGDYDPGESDESFDRLFRRHLGNLYKRLEEAVPEELEPAPPGQSAA